MKAHELRSLYNHGYFHGVTSGYPSEGYAAVHPDWEHWISYVRRVRPEARFWLDIGCAYGYLVLDSRRNGFRAVGTDISSFALRQNSEAAPYLVESLAENQPFPDRSFDVVSIFDVIEHFAIPELAVAEIARLLKPGGLCIGSTPDPLFFHRQEETHFSENPPSYWFDLFRRQGMEMAFRFAGEPFNMEFAAVRGLEGEASGAAQDAALQSFRHDRFQPDPDVLEISRDLQGPLRYAYRSGWSILQEPDKSFRLATAPSASLYLMNTESSPLELEIEIAVPLAGIFGSFRAQLDDRPIGSVHLENIDETRKFRLETVLLASGGHHLHLFLENGLAALPVQAISISGRRVSHAELVSSFPFDLYQRYESVRQLLQSIYRVADNDPVPKARVLDIGGLMGGASGHMGSLADFLPGWSVTISDVRICDTPIYRPVPPDELPFAPDSCEVLVCLDVFEHIPQPLRPAFLSRLLEIPSQLLILGCPCFGQEVCGAEEVLDEFIKCKLGYRHNFIAEHQEYGLPRQSEIEEAIRSRGLELISVPNGYLPRWLFMQLVTFYVSTLQSARLSEKINRFYNREFYRLDNAEPAYRRVFAVDTRGRGLLRHVDVAGLVVHPGQRPELAHWAERAVLLLQLINEEELNRRGLEVSRLAFLLGEREKYVADLLRHIGNLEQIDATRQAHIGNLEKEAADLHQHVRNLESERDELRRHSLNLDTHRDQLQSILLNSQSAMADRDQIVYQLQQSVGSLERERMLLLQRLNEAELDRLEAQNRAMELDARNLDLGGRISAMEAHLAASREQEDQLQSRIKSLESEYLRLDGLFTGKKLRDIVPLLKEYFRRSIR